MLWVKLDRYMQKKRERERERKKLDHFLMPYTIKYSKWIKYLNGIPETMKLLEENIGNKLFDIPLSNMFLDMSFQAGETKKIKQMGPHQTKKVFAQQRPSTK